MLNFGEKLKELMITNNLDYEKLSDNTKIDKDYLYSWGINRYLPSITNLIILANYFNCSVDYLLGFEETKYDNAIFHECPAFSVMLDKHLKRTETSRYKLVKETKIGKSVIDNWYNGKHVPQLENIIKLAKHFNVTIDILIGRQN